MLDLHPKYQVDERGQRIVILTEEEYENLLAWAEANEPDPDSELNVSPDFEADLHRQSERVKRGQDKPVAWEQVKHEVYK